MANRWNDLGANKKSKPKGINVAFTDILRRGRILFACIILFPVLVPGRSAAEESHQGTIFQDCPECPVMVVVPPGKFMMGSTKADTERDFATVPPAKGLLESILISPKSMATTAMTREYPQHLVFILKSFALGKYPVTRAEFAAFVRDTGYSPGRDCLPVGPHANIHSRVSWQRPEFQQTDRDPVVCVSWDDARAYIVWLNGRVSHTAIMSSAGPYRLPSEAEWEYAARAGTDTARWWGNSIGKAKANCAECGDPPRLDGHTTPVGSFPPNAFGLYDMLGNVFEYTEDCFHDNYAGAPSDGQPWGDKDCSKISFRGGGWSSQAWVLRSAQRSGWKENSKSSASGFRVAKSLQ